LGVCSRQDTTRTGERCLVVSLLFPLVLSTQMGLNPIVPVQLKVQAAAQIARTLVPPAPKTPSAPVRVSSTEAPDVVVVHPIAYQAPIAYQPLTFASLAWPWPCITWHESTWNLAAINPSSGDAGGFQISQYMWDQFKTASMPWWIPSASLDQQYQVAVRIEQAYGWNQWETAQLCGA